MTDTDPVLISVADGVAHLELNRPEVFNALDVPLAKALESALRRAGEDPEVKVVLLSGRGKAFCAGGDVKAMAGEPEMVEGLAEASHRAVRAMIALDKPLIAAVHGSAAGAGLGYVCAADLVLAGESAKLLSAFIAIGASPDSSTSWFLPRIVGQRRAMELMLLNRVLTATEAQDWGLVTAVHPDDQLHDAALSLARKLAAGPAQGLGHTRRLVHDGWERSLDEHLDHEAAGIARLTRTPESLALIQAFANR